MRRPAVLVLTILVVLLAIAAIVLFANYRKASTNYAEMKTREETARVGYSEAFNAITEIQDSLNAIAVSDTALKMLTGRERSEMRATEGVRRQALQNIALLNASLQRNKQRINRLETNLRQRGVRVAALEKLLTGLKQQVSEKEQVIASLTAQIDTLHTQVSGLQTQVQQGQDTIRQREASLEEQRRQSATIYYIVGNKTELVRAGIIRPRGGVLGLGRTLIVTARPNESLFTPLDTDRESVIHTPAAKVQVLSAQPATSYELQLVDGKIQLHILDPNEFRKVKYLVIMTK